MKVNRIEIADFFGVAKTTVDQWRRDGCPFEGGGGKGKPLVYDTAKVFEWLLQRNQGRHGKYSELLEKERYRKVRRENDEAEKLLAPVSLIVDVLGKSSSIIIPILENLPLLLKRNWPEITGDQIFLVKKSIAECKNIIADSRLPAEWCEAAAEMAEAAIEAARQKRNQETGE